MTDKTVVAGNSVIFRLLLTCPKEEWCDLNVEMTGDSENGTAITINYGS